VAKVSCSLVEFLVPISDLVSTAACLKTVFCLPLVVSYAVDLVLDPPVSKARVFLIFIVLIWRLLGHARKAFDETVKMLFDLSFVAVIPYHMILVLTC
jgi:hypothetical protein